MPNPALQPDRGGTGVSAGEQFTTEATRASLVRVLVVKAQELTMKLWINSLVDAAPARTTSSGGVFHFSRSFVSFDLLVERFDVSDGTFILVPL
jgi:hypothetical protein